MRRFLLVFIAPGQAVQFWIGGVSFRNNQIVDFVRPSQGAAVVAGHGALTRHPFTVGQLGLSLHDDRIVVGAARNRTRVYRSVGSSRRYCLSFARLIAFAR